MLRMATIYALLTLSLHPDTVESSFRQGTYHNDRANDSDLNHDGVTFSFKRGVDTVAKYIDSEEIKYFERDKGAAKEEVRRYGTGKEEGHAPNKDF